MSFTSSTKKYALTGGQRSRSWLHKNEINDYVEAVPWWWHILLLLLQNRSFCVQSLNFNYQDLYHHELVCYMLICISNDYLEFLLTKPPCCILVRSINHLYPNLFKIVWQKRCFSYHLDDQDHFVPDKKCNQIDIYWKGPTPPFGSNWTRLWLHRLQ